MDRQDTGGVGLDRNDITFDFEVLDVVFCVHLTQSITEAAVASAAGFF